MGQLACLMSGNWYSTQSVSQCRSGIDSDCWWRLKSPLRGDREINASCADERVQQALRRRRPECWAQCGAQANNVTALCPVMCLFSTMLGNRTANIPPMEKNDVVQPFVDAFKPVAEGGCPARGACCFQLRLSSSYYDSSIAYSIYSARDAARL
jgi:hypothetical protein